MGREVEEQETSARSTKEAVLGMRSRRPSAQIKGVSAR